MKFRILFAALAFALAPGVTSAQTGADAAPAATSPANAGPAVDPDALTAARRVIVASHTEELFQHTVELIIPSMMAPLADAYGLTADQRRTVQQAVIEEINGDPQPIIDMMARTYASHLSAADLNAIADFYESPAGQHMVAATPQMQSEMAVGGREWAQQVLAPRLVRRIQEMTGRSAPGHT